MSIARIVISRTRTVGYRTCGGLVIEGFSYHQAAGLLSLPPPWTTYGTARAAISLFQGLSRKEVDTYGSQVRRRKLRLESIVGRQSRLSRAGEEDVKLDEILVGKAVRGVISHGQRPVEIGDGHLRRQRMKLHHEQPEPPHVWSPAAKVSNQILFQFIRRNLLAQVREGAARSSLPRPANVIGRRKIGAIVIQ